MTLTEPEAMKAVGLAALDRTLREGLPEDADSARRFAAALLDKVPEARLQIRVLRQALEDGVLRELRKDAATVDLAAARLAQRLEHAHGYRPELARWAVGVLASITRVHDPARPDSAPVPLGALAPPVPEPVPPPPVPQAPAPARSIPAPSMPFGTATPAFTASQPETPRRETSRQEMPQGVSAVPAMEIAPLSIGLTAAFVLLGAAATAAVAIWMSEEIFDAKIHRRLLNLDFWIPAIGAMMLALTVAALVSRRLGAAIGSAAIASAAVLGITGNAAVLTLVCLSALAAEIVIFLLGRRPGWLVPGLALGGATYAVLFTLLAALDWFPMNRIRGAGEAFIIIGLFLGGTAILSVILPAFIVSRFRKSAPQQEGVPQ